MSAVEARVNSGESKSSTMSKTSDVIARPQQIDPGNQGRSWRWRIEPALLAFALLGVAGCNAGAEGGGTTPRSAPPAKPIGLTITSYNYTNRYIDQFFVNGQGGGNVFVSTPDAGGGKGTCCVMYAPGTPPPKTVRVKWQASGCMYRETNSSGEVSSWTHSYFKEADAPVDPRVPTNPANFEVHFYPDGHVEAAITGEISLPRLKLPESREDRSDYPDCPGSKKPESNVHVETQR